MTPAVVHTVTATSMAELRAHRDAAVGDMVELRLDYVTDLDVAGALAGRRKPVIVTCRASWEGGRFEGDEATRLRVLARAIELGAEYVDVEWKADRRSLPLNPASTLVVSHHDFSGMPVDLPGMFRAMAAERAGVVKVAVTPRTLRDCVALRDASRIDVPHVAIAMGPVGQLTRVAPVLLGSLWTYGGTAAPGQTAASELVDVYRVRRQSASTTLYGVAGSPLGHSASPVMHNAAFAALGIDAVYVTLDTDDAGELLDVGEAFGLAGASVTAPLKTGVFARVPDHDDLSSRIGALNTLRRIDGRWEGRNYDVAGFLSPLLRRGEVLRNKRCVVIGAGGAARTALWALQSHGAHVEVAARREERARALAAEFGAGVSAWPPVAGWDLLVNTTPAGTWPETGRMPIDADAVRGRLVYDLIYNPEETRLLQVARANGADTIGGLEMLVGQACHQFEWWTGRTAPRDVMAEAARRFLLARQAHV